MGNDKSDQASRFKLERTFEDLSAIFESSNVPDASSAEVLLVLDTNVLLLPYTIRKDNLPKLQEFYEKILEEGRLFLPARVAREFIRNRDIKLADLLKTLSDVKSRINIGETRLSPILEGVDGSEGLSKASEALGKAKKEYVAAISLLENSVRSWSGNDPVTQVYSRVFSEHNMISPNLSEEALISEWDFRRSNSIPPGYKDGNKDDTGIGDFLIWKSILHLGAKFKKDLIFVTGDEKADWFVRSNGTGAYPRPELIAEYRKFSEGRNLRLASLHDILLEMEVSKDFVTEVERAEDDANTEARLGHTSPVALSRKTTSFIKGDSEGRYEMLNFVMPYGGADISIQDQGTQFKFQVSEAGINSFWVYPNSTGNFFFAKNGGTGKLPNIKDQIAQLPSQLKNFRIGAGQRFYIQNEDNMILSILPQKSNLPNTDEDFVLSFTAAIFSIK